MYTKEIRKSIPNEVCIKPKSPPQKKVTIAKQGIYKTICKQSIYSKTFFILIASYQLINFLITLILKNHFFNTYITLLSFVIAITSEFFNYMYTYLINTYS